MNAVDTNYIQKTLVSMLELQRTAYLAAPIPSFAERRKDLATLLRMMKENREDIIAAINEDYGNRSRHESLFVDFIAVTDTIKEMIRKTKSWMQPQKRHVDQIIYPGAKNRVIPQPLGVVGIIVPWNFPCNLSMIPVATAFSAGNRAMVKMSENSRKFTQLLQRITPDYFPTEKLAFIEETGGVGIEFSRLHFDLMVFTGSGETGKAVMASASKNLCPVILELGGKSPAIIDPGYDLEKAVQRIMFAKQFNAGQICTNVDYVYVHESQLEEFTRLAAEYVNKHVPDINSPDYTSVIDEKSFLRLQQAILDVRDKDGRVLDLSRGQSSRPGLRKFPLHLVIDPTEDMIISQRETFGPILTVRTYRDSSEVVAYVNSKERPLALYPFSYNKRLVQYYVDRIMSGGVTVNDAMLHVTQHDIPFGGVGASGMGHYHGYEGFLSFSKLRPLFYQTRFSALKFIQPPYGGLANWIYGTLLKLKT